MLHYVIYLLNKKKIFISLVQNLFKKNKNDLFEQN